MSYLRTKKVHLGEREIIVKELSIAGQLRLEEKENTTFDDILCECLGAEQYKWYKDNIEDIPRNFYRALQEAINEVNARDTPDKKPVVEKTGGSETFRENAASGEEKAGVEEEVLVSQ